MVRENPLHHFTAFLFKTCGIYFRLVILLAAMAMPVMADQDLRPFEDDAGLFDPAKGPAQIRFQLLKDTDRVEIRVQDFRGQIVGNYHLIELRAGDHTFVWDGKDADGELLADGRYQLLFRAEYTDGSDSTAVVEIRLATIKPPERIQAPEPLPPEEYKHRIQGSLSTFWKHNGDRDSDKDSGEARLLADFAFKEEQRRAKGVLSVLQPFYEGPTSFNGSRALVEQGWNHGKVKGVFREGLGNFDDPMKLFSDFQSERKKAGMHLDYNNEEFNSRCLFFGAEGDVDSQEQGAAVRMKLGNQHRWQLGASYTFREAMVPTADNTRFWNHATAADLRLPVTEELAMVMEVVHTSDSEQKDDDGYVATAHYDRGNLRFSGGYIDLGENFSAPFADPLHHVSEDARGLDASVDYSMSSPLGYLENPAVTLGYFDLERHSDNQKIREMDASLRFGIGPKDTFFISWFGQEEGSNSNHTIRGNAEHKWNAMWASRLQANHSFADMNRTWRFALDTSCRRKTGSARLALEWIKREIDTSRLSPFEEANLRFDWKHELWGLQLQTRHSQNQDESGVNFFGRLEYKPVFFHRYRFIIYTAVGNRAASSFEEQVEIGMEIRY